MAVSEKLWINDFDSMDERAELFKEALYLSMEDSVRIWLVDAISFAPQRADMQVAYDLAGGVAGSSLFAYTIRFKDKEGGTMRVAQPACWSSPGTPSPDQLDLRHDADPLDPGWPASLPTPTPASTCPTRSSRPPARSRPACPWPRRLTGSASTLPTQSRSRRRLGGLDPVNQVFIEAGKMTTPTLETNTKCTTTYPADLWEVTKWHDGSPLTLADFIMYMIVTFDRGKVGGTIYDEALAPQVDAFLSHFRGVTIDSTDPLVITTYDDLYYLDAEWMPTTWFPEYAQGPGAWHTWPSASPPIPRASSHSRPTRQGPSALSG